MRAAGHLKATISLTAGAAALAGLFVLAPVSPAAAGCGGGGGGGHSSAPSQDSTPYQPKKLTVADRKRLTDMIEKEGKARQANYGDHPPPALVKEIQKLINDLDPKGYDTDPEYEKLITQLKTGLTNAGDVQWNMKPTTLFSGNASGK
ncbi:MAG: hypothetical protein ABSF67_16240 [Roseiarcus sp.]|jgi:hypothetical protein